MDAKWAERVEAKIDRLDARLDKTDITLAAQHEQLSYHIKRTDLLEKKWEQEFKPLQRWIYMAMGAVALLLAVKELIIK